jgi:hypothetical protein
MSTVQPISGHKGRDRWICAILTRNDLLTPLEMRVAIRLGLFFNCQTGQCNPGYARLAAELGISPRSARRCVAALVDHGFVGRDEGAGGRHDQKRNFSLFMPPARGTKILSPVGGTAIVSPVEMSPDYHDGGQEPGGTGDKNRGERGTIRRPTKEPDEPDEPEGGLTAPHTSRAVRESIINSSADDAPVPEPPTPPERAPERAPRDLLNDDDHDRDRSSAPIAPAIGIAPSAAQAAFAEVWRVWPPDCMGDERKVAKAFDDALAAAGGDTTVVLDAIDNLLWESGADPQLLPDALATIARDPRQQATNRHRTGAAP